MYRGLPSGHMSHNPPADDGDEDGTPATPTQEALDACLAATRATIKRLGPPRVDPDITEMGRPPAE